MGRWCSTEPSLAPHCCPCPRPMSYFMPRKGRFARRAGTRMMVPGMPKGLSCEGEDKPLRGTWLQMIYARPWFKGLISCCYRTQTRRRGHAHFPARACINDTLCLVRAGRHRAYIRYLSAAQHTSGLDTKRCACLRPCKARHNQVMK